MFEVYLDDKVVFSSTIEKEVTEYCNTHNWDYVCEKVLRGINHKHH